MLGVIVPDTNFSERSVMVFKELNRAVKKIGEYCLFYVNLSSQVSFADFAIMNITEVNNAYGGTLIATCPISADILRKAAVNANKAYYLMDLGFLLAPYDFNEMYKTLSGLTLIVRSEEHQKFIKNLFNLDSIVLPFDLGLLCNTLSPTPIN
jgi:hypothetical protein